MDSREALVGLNMMEYVGPVRVRQLIVYFCEAPAILKATKTQLMKVRGIVDEVDTSITSWEKNVDLTAEVKRIEKFGCKIVIQSDENYPPLLKEIYDPPIVLYVKGDLTTKDANGVAMVGSRLTAPYGMEIARKLSY